MSRLYLLLLALLLNGVTASAQPTYRLGVRGGLNRATATLADASTSPANSPFTYSGTKSAIYAWQVGAVLEIAYRHFALQPALVFSQKGERFDTYTSTSGFAGTTVATGYAISRPNWLELPLNAVYTLKGFQVFAGPYVALAVGGRRGSTYRYVSSGGQSESFEFSEKIRYGSDTENRRVDAGVNFGLGYRKGSIQVQLGYGFGLRNLHQAPVKDIIYENPYYHNFNADQAYNRVTQLTATYFFVR